jgi:hypothetical protein
MKIEKEYRLQPNKYQSMDYLQQFWIQHTLLTTHRLQSQQNCTILPVSLCMSELASATVWATPVLPKTIASTTLGLNFDWSSNEFMLSVCEAALVLVGTVS